MLGLFPQNIPLMSTQLSSGIHPSPNLRDNHEYLNWWNLLWASNPVRGTCLWICAKGKSVPSHLHCGAVLMENANHVGNGGTCKRNTPNWDYSAEWKSMRQRGLNNTGNVCCRFHWEALNKIHDQFYLRVVFSTMQSFVFFVSIASKGSPWDNFLP